MEEQGNLTHKEKATIMYNNFRVFLYNKDKGEVMGRNAESWGMWWLCSCCMGEINSYPLWFSTRIKLFKLLYVLSSTGKIGLFFFVYYSCLAAFFAAMFAIAFSTMPEIKDGPKYTSIISDKPCK